jgi:hypothetical protein
LFCVLEEFEGGTREDELGDDLVDRGGRGKRVEVDEKSVSEGYERTRSTIMSAEDALPLYAGPHHLLSGSNFALACTCLFLCLILTPVKDGFCSCC